MIEASSTGSFSGLVTLPHPSSNSLCCVVPASNNCLNVFVNYMHSNEVVSNSAQC